MGEINVWVSRTFWGGSYFCTVGPVSSDKGGGEFGSLGSGRDGQGLSGAMTADRPSPDFEVLTRKFVTNHLALSREIKQQNAAPQYLTVL